MRALKRMTMKELRGRKVRNLEPITTRGGIIFAPGTVFDVTGKFSGLELRQTSTCDACGSGAHRSVNKVSPEKLELLSETEVAPGPGNGALEKARDEGFSSAICYVLGYLNGVGDNGSTMYEEILAGCDRDKIIAFAKAEEEMEFTGLDRYLERQP